MRVLMLTAPLPTDSRPGTMAAVARQIDSIASLGIEVDVVEIHGVRRIKYLQTLWPLLERAPAADLIHAHYGYSGWVARMQWRRPVVVSFMGSDLLGIAGSTGRSTMRGRLVVQIDRGLARVVDAVIVKSREMADAIGGVRAHIIPNGVDLSLFRPDDRAAARGHLGWDDGVPRVLFPSNPADPHKGFQTTQSAVEVASASLGTPIEIVPLWGVAPKAVPTYMNACDALLMTSFSEGSPNAVKEAMACNLPVVSVDVGDVTELLSGVRLSAVAPRDPARLGAELAQVLRQGARSDGHDALQARGLDLASVARRVAAVYEEVVGGSRSRRVRGGSGP
jgi:glycosyltransferase involved in cell wall biosynthesis